MPIKELTLDLPSKRSDAQVCVDECHVRWPSDHSQATIPQEKKCRGKGGGEGKE